MTFYKLLDVVSGHNVYTNPKAIDYYIYLPKKVEIHLKSQDYFYVDKVDFHNMMTLEGVDEY